MPSILSRDLDLDLSLESEARTTLIIAGVAVGVLVLFAVVIFFKQYIRRYEGLTRTNSNTTDSTVHRPAGTFLFVYHVLTHTFT